MQLILSLEDRIATMVTQEEYLYAQSLKEALQAEIEWLKTGIECMVPRAEYDALKAVLLLWTLPVYP